MITIDLNTEIEIYREPFLSVYRMEYSGDIPKKYLLKDENIAESRELYYGKRSSTKGVSDNIICCLETEEFHWEISKEYVYAIYADGNCFPAEDIFNQVVKNSDEIYDVFSQQ